MQYAFYSNDESFDRNTLDVSEFDFGMQQSDPCGWLNDPEPVFNLMDEQIQSNLNGCIIPTPHLVYEGKCFDG